jgi:YVTN family beta-propeller protein
MKTTLTIALALVGALVLAGLAGARSEPSRYDSASGRATSSAISGGQARKCGGVTVRLGGKRVCVAAGRPCQAKYERTYERLGFTCSGGTLYRRVVTPNAQILATISVGGGPTAIRFLAGSIWVLNSFDGTLSRIDPSSNTVVATIKVGGGWGDITSGDGSIWEVSEERSLVARIDPTTNSVIATIPEPGIRPMGLAWTPGAIWVTNHAHDPGQQAVVARIDTATNQVVWKAGVGNASAGNLTGGPDWITPAFGAVWFVVGNADELDRIDPSSNTVTKAVSPFACGADAEPLAGSLWLSDCSLGFYRLDPATNAVVRVPASAGGDNGPLATDGSYLWGTTVNGFLSKFDPASGKVVARWRQPAMGLFASAPSLAYGEGSIWVADNSGNRVLRLKP